ncbi:MAG: glycosyltransferase family 4 protein [Verrucomicrobia bacterium]|nr:glycosyltransferase family 4 protein [Verrucomicrobiota bacterium]
MKILLLAPHPYYQERGTPIAVDLLLKALSARGDEIRVLTYHEGAERDHPNVRIERIRPKPGVKRLGPGFSLKKLYCDIFLFQKAVSLTHQFRPDLIHAVEESVFIAQFLKAVYRIPYIYDMDSSLPEQMCEKNSIFSMLSPLLRWFEKRAVRNARAVVPVCGHLVQLADRYGSKRTVLLRDISLLDQFGESDPADLRWEDSRAGVRFMYVGNLESYQGIDLLLESFAIARKRSADISLIIVGGTEKHIAAYRSKCVALGISDAVTFAGPAPLKHMRQLFGKTDVLVSPRTKGVNTPMKIYSYLDSGKPVLATDILSHTDFMTPAISFLAPPEKEAFAEAMLTLARDKELRERLGEAAHAHISAQNSFESFSKTVNDLYDDLEKLTETRQE